MCYNMINIHIKPGTHDYISCSGGVNGDLPTGITLSDWKKAITILKNKAEKGISYRITALVPMEVYHRLITSTINFISSRDLPMALDEYGFIGIIDDIRVFNSYHTPISGTSRLGHPIYSIYIFIEYEKKTGNTSDIIELRSTIL